MKNVFTAAAVASCILGASLAPASANPEARVMISIGVKPTVATVGGAIGIGVLANEAFARKPFGNNGEGMKILHKTGGFLKKVFRW